MVKNQTLFIKETLTINLILCVFSLMFHRSAGESSPDVPKMVNIRPDREIIFRLPRQPDRAPLNFPFLM
jgi:hypothetical protein